MLDAVVYNGAVYCLGCLPEGTNPDRPDVVEYFEDSMYEPICCVCHKEIRETVTGKQVTVDYNYRGFTDRFEGEPPWNDEI